VNYRIELFVLGQYHDEAAVGVYSIAVTVAESLWLITTAIATGIWAPAIHSEEQRAAALVARSALKGLLLVSAAAGVLALLAPVGLPLVFGDRYDSAVGPLHYLLPGIAAYAPVQVITIYLSVRRGRPGFALVGPVLSVVVTTLLAFALVPEHAGEGAAIASSAGYVLSALVVWGFFLRLARLP
jgi:O-antigen/teichoic acid export membrane protein